ncbi:xanthine dehydrogenase family protein molybdopterin-binding subunit [Rhodococcus rhodnii]|uniref:Xanthine dehydrogenase family protein molybdopterin-binding subunit n=1 Tax=Rhodococcus rhodnii TaxID=38312 RepID=A0A6P2CL05_9NOCA|nr:xanthine dehydrogenase family protein molybdopterin-binding subunit [Rhodococcus rhodnii]
MHRWNRVGADGPRVDGELKVRGEAPYAYEQDAGERAYLAPIRSTIARGTVTTMDVDTVRTMDGVLLVLTPWNAPALADTSDAEFAVLQDIEVHFHGELIGAVVAETPEIAADAAARVTVEYDIRTQDSAFFADHPAAYEPDDLNGVTPVDESVGDVDAALAAAVHRVDEWYSTPEEHNNPMEPHATVARWEPDSGTLTMYDSTQVASSVSYEVARVLGMDTGDVRVVSPFVGGGFGSKGSPHAHNVLAAMAARELPGRAVTFALTRRQMFEIVGYRSPTVSHVQLGTDADGRLTALAHDSFSQTARVKEFAENASTVSRSVYATESRRTTHRMVPLDVPIPFWMRAPGESPGMFAVETALDELAHSAGIDPVELRIRNDAPVDPASGNPWSSRRLVECLRRGAEVFGWEGRDPRPALRRDGRWLVGTGMASAYYPHLINPGTRVSIRALPEGRYAVSTAAADIGQGAWTALTAIAADALGVDPDRISLHIGDSALPRAAVAGGSSGTATWGTTIVAAAEEFRAKYGDDPDIDDAVTTRTPELPQLERTTPASFGAHFVEVRVDADTGEVRVPRMRSVYSVGRVINPRTVRSQFLGGMIMGISMALQEHSVRDARFGHIVTADLAQYHFPVNADIEDIDAQWLDESDDVASPMGSRGAGEIGIVGSAAAVGNAVWHATGARLRSLPIQCDALLPHLPD